jgi:hypothetical protein
MNVTIRENEVSQHVRANPDVTVEALTLRFPGLDPWTARNIRREVRREMATPEGTVDASATGLSRNAQTLLRAGYFRPVKLELQERPEVKPIFKKAGQEILVLPDIHAPDHDPDALDVALQIGQSLSVDGIIINGDGFDVHALSRYTTAADRPFRWVDERAAAVPVFQMIREFFPDTPIDYLFGNHCRRAEDFIARVAPQLQGLQTLPELLGLTDLGFRFHDTNRVILADNQLMVKHGTKVAGEAGGSVQKEVKEHGMSIIMAHVHRRALYEVTRTAQVLRGEQPLLGVEPGCLCHLDPDYKEKENTANWQHGCVVVTLHDDGTFDVEPVRIFKNRAFFRGLQFRSRIARP